MVSRVPQGERRPPSRSLLPALAGPSTHPPRPHSSGVTLQGHGDPPPLPQQDAGEKTSPVNTSFRTLKVSMMGVVMPDMVPIMLPSPRFISIRKNMTDQNGEAGKWVMASVKAMKARPVPCTDCSGRDRTKR